MSRYALLFLCGVTACSAVAADSIFGDKPRPPETPISKPAPPAARPEPAPVIAGPAAPAPDPKLAPEALLSSKGLLKVGTIHLLPTDANLADFLRIIRAAKVKSDAGAARRAEIERQIERAKDAYQAALRDSVAIHERMSKVKKGDARRYNELVGEAREADSRAAEAARTIEQRDKELRKLGDGHDDYVGLTVSLAEEMQAAAKRYDALAADADVAAALAALNARGGAKVALGPSAQFSQEFPAALRTRDLVAARAIRLTFDGGTPHALVMLNGRTEILMTVDSGAALVTLSADVAKDLGLKPDPGVPPLTLVTADGKKVEARQSTLTSVRVGPYTVSDVRCAIMPAAIKGSNLLGGTFLKNFVFRLDLAASELHMKPVGGQVAVRDVPALPQALPTTSTPPQPAISTPLPPNPIPAPIAVATPPASLPATKPSLPASADGRRVVDLLPMFDIKTGAVAGVWRIRDGELMFESGKDGRIQSTYRPPAEYDYVIEFSRPKGGGNVLQLCARGETAFEWCMGTAGNTARLQNVDGHARNATQRKLPADMADTDRHISIVQVRESGLRMLLDGKQVLDFKTNYSNLTRNAIARLHDDHLLGLGGWEQPIIFHKVSVIEGAGK